MTDLARSLKMLPNLLWVPVQERDWSHSYRDGSFIGHYAVSGESRLITPLPHEWPITKFVDFRPRHGVAAQRFQDHAIANSTDAYFLAFETEPPRQPHGLTPPVHEQFCCCFHDLAKLDAYQIIDTTNRHFRQFDKQPQAQPHFAASTSAATVYDNPVQDRIESRHVFVSIAWFSASEYRSSSAAKRRVAVKSQSTWLSTATVPQNRGSSRQIGPEPEFPLPQEDDLTRPASVAQVVLHHTS